MYTDAIIDLFYQQLNVVTQTGLDLKQILALLTMLTLPEYTQDNLVLSLKSFNGFKIILA